MVGAMRAWGSRGAAIISRILPGACLAMFIDFRFLWHRPPKSISRTRHSLSQTVPSFCLYLLCTMKDEVLASTR